MALTAAEAIRQAADTHPMYWTVREAIRKAARSDEYADLAGERPTALRDLRRVLNRASREITELINHSHEWNADDYCSICGADGRA